MKNKTLYIMCGVPGSGKSTFIQKYLNNNVTTIVSRDEIRFSMLKDDEDYFAHENAVYKEFIRQIKEGLKNNDTVCADATHLNAGSRGKLLKALYGNLCKVNVIPIVVVASLQTCIDRNATREGRAFVPEDQIKRMYHQFTIPTKEEGFKEIVIYDSETSKLKLKEFI